MSTPHNAHKRTTDGAKSSSKKRLKLSTPYNVEDTTAVSSSKTRGASSHRGSSRRRCVSKQPQTPPSEHTPTAGRASTTETAEFIGDFLFACCPSFIRNSLTIIFFYCELEKNRCIARGSIKCEDDVSGLLARVRQN